MDQDSTARWQGLIDRMNQGDAAARRELVGHTYGRLHALAGGLLRHAFPGLKKEHGPSEVVHEAWLRLSQALEASRPPTVADFFRLAAHKMRQVLLDLADRHRRRPAGTGGDCDSGGGPAVEPAASTLDPARLAVWTEVHRQVEHLPEQERLVFDLHYYQGLPQAEVAQILGLHPRQVSRLWGAATDRLGEALQGIDGLL